MSNLMTVATHRIARLVRHPEPLPAQPARFVGVATLMTSRPDFRGPYARPVSAELLIDERGRVTVSSLYLAPVKVGSVTCTISRLPRTGIGTYAADDLRLTIGLHVGIDVLRGAQDYRLPRVTCRCRWAADARRHRDIPRRLPRGTVGEPGRERHDLPGRWGRPGEIEALIRPTRVRRTEAPCSWRGRRRTTTPACTWRERTC
jgi:hypothetical protein